MASKERALRARGGAIQLIRQDHLMKQRTFFKFELLRLGIDERHTQDVRRQQDRW